MYTSPRVVALIREHFVPVRIHVQHNADLYKELGRQYEVEWTPTVLVLDADGKARHRIEGFLPEDDFRAQLMLGLAHAAFAAGRYDEAASLHEAVAAEHGASEAAPEAVYWAGVSRYKSSGDASALQQTAARFRTRYEGSSWAKKASVWA